LTNSTSVLPRIGKFKDAYPDLMQTDANERAGSRARWGRSARRCLAERSALSACRWRRSNSGS